MKKLLMLALLMLAGCTTTQTLNLARPSLNEWKTANIGDMFFEREEGEQITAPGIVNTFIGGYRFDLTIVELNEQKIGLLFGEYDRPYFTTEGKWIIKHGYNKRFDYAVTDKIINFRGYEFEILGVEKGQIKYRRIK